MSIWLVAWSAGILVVLWMLGGAVWRGELGAAPFLLIWLGFAGLGLYAGARRLQTLVGLVPPPARPAARAGHVWTDGPEVGAGEAPVPDALPDAPAQREQDDARSRRDV